MRLSHTSSLPAGSMTPRTIPTDGEEEDVEGEEGEEEQVEEMERVDKFTHQGL